MAEKDESADSIVKWYSINPTWYKPNLVRQTVIFGEMTGSVDTDSCLAINWYPTGSKLDADFDEWDLLSRHKDLIDALAYVGQKYRKDLSIEQVCDILKQCGFVEDADLEVKGEG